MRTVPLGLVYPYLSGWMRRRINGVVPVVFPGTRRLIQVPLADFYECYWFFCESDHGMTEVMYLLERLKSGDVLFDIGAFRGACGVAAKARYGDAVSVHLFEPLATNWQAIQKIAELNRLQRFELARLALGRGTPVIGRVNSQDCMLRKGDETAPDGDLEFPSTTLDQYVADTGAAPTIIKMDVDGFELDVLEGGKETLSKLHPRLWIEVHPTYLAQQGRDWNEVIRLLELIGYRITYFDDYEAATRDASFHIWAESAAHRG